MDKRELWLIGFSLIGMFLLGLPALAATITVTTTADEVNTNGQCSLREAIINANTDSQSGSTDCAAGSGADTIVLQSGATYTLSKDTDGGGHQTDSGADNDDLDITSDITIQGNGATIERSTVVPCTLNDTAETGEFRIFHVASGSNLTLDNVTVRNGCADSSSFPHYRGGGIFVESWSTVTITNSTISDNSADGGGGGIQVNGSTVTITNSTISDNSAAVGGGILNFGAITITSSTISGNSAANHGGGIYNHSAQMIITGSTLSGNSARLGGGIYNSDAVMAITSSTISGNSAADYGGGILNVHGRVGLSFATITSNSAAGAGGGIRVSNGGAFNIKNSIVGNNTAPLGPNCSLAEGAIDPSGVNYATDGSCTGFTQVTSTQLNLGSLVVNPPGTTATHMLLSGSVAIDAATDCTLLDGTTPVTEDQRGVPRPQPPSGGTCDVGAYEARFFTLTVTGAGTGNGTGTGTGINCTITAGSTSGDCSEGNFLEGAVTSVTLTAVPAPDSTFAGWTNCDAPSGTQCTMTMNAEKTVTATFNLVNRTLTVSKAGTGSGTVTSNPLGINCGNDCQESYTHGTPVTLTATPDANSVFIGWSGDCNASGQVTMNADKTCTATFNLTVSCTGVQVSVRPTRATFRPTPRRPDTRRFSVTVRNNSGGPVTVNAITLRPDKFDSTYTLVRISPILPQTVLNRRSSTFTVMVRKAANTPAQTVTAPFFDVQMSCGVLPASERLIPLRVKGLQVEQHAGQVRVAALGEGIASIGLELFDLSGRRLLTQGEEGRELTVAVNGLANGVYLYVVRVRGFDGREYVSEVRKLVIVR